MGAVCAAEGRETVEACACEVFEGELFVGCIAKLSEYFDTCIAFGIFYVMIDLIALVGGKGCDDNCCAVARDDILLLESKESEAVVVLIAV